MLADPRSVKIPLSCQYLFALLGSVGVKAARKSLVKLTSIGSLLFTFDSSHDREVTFLPQSFARVILKIKLFISKSPFYLISHQISIYLQPLSYSLL